MDELRSLALRNVKWMLPAALATAAAIVYGPMLSAPLEIRDYSEFLLVLPESRNLGASFTAVSDYFAGHGRFLPLTHGFIALNWVLFGLDSTGWQLMRATLMAGCAVAAFALLRRLGATTLAAAAGSVLFLFTPGGTAGWVRLTGEPLSTLALLLAGMLATSYGRTSNWRAAGAGVAALAAASVLAKETSIAAVPFVIALAWFAPRGEPGSREGADRSGRRTWLVAATAVFVAAALAAIAFVAVEARATPDSYVAGYGDASPSFTTFLRRAQAIAFPFVPGEVYGLRMIRLLPNLVLGGVVVIAGLLSLEAPALRRRWGLSMAAAVALPLSGAIAYLPWARFETFYTLPFIFGSALAVATSLTIIERRRPRLAFVAYAATIVPTFYMAVAARETVSRTVGMRTVNGAVVARIKAHSSRDAIFVADPYPPKQSWQGLGATLARSASFLGARPAPRVFDVSCDRAQGDETARANTVLISFSNLCGTLDRRSESIRHVFAYLDWRTMSVVRDSIRADLRVNAGGADSTALPLPGSER